MTKSQIDRLGERLKKGNIEDADLRMLDEYRRSFADAYEAVVRVLRDPLGFRPTGRPAKSTPSIVDKLQRESIRLSQVQDIAGCRIVVDDVPVQEAAVASLCRSFGKTSVSDRRRKPSHGYRAVHVIVASDERPVEVQIRTALQHLWAELSEKLSDMIDPTIKYGGGPAWAQSVLSMNSETIGHIESLELELSRLPFAAPFSDEQMRMVADQRNELKRMNRDLATSLQNLIASYEKGGNG